MKYTFAPRRTSQPNLWGYRLVSMAILGLLLFNLPGPLGRWKALPGPRPAAPLQAQEPEIETPGLQACQEAGEAPEPGLCSDGGLSECGEDALRRQEADGQTIPRCTPKGGVLRDSD